MIRKRGLKWALLMLIAFIALSAPSNVPTASAIATVYVDPLITMEEPGEHFNVTLNVANVADLYAWQVVMSFNSSVLEVVDLYEGDFLAEQPEGTSALMKQIFNDEGWCGLGLTTLGFYAGVTGNGWLGTVEFLVKGIGDSYLNITDPVGLKRTKILDSLPPEPSPMPFTPEDGFFTSEQKKPVASFTFSPESPSAGDTVTFNASASYDPDGIIVDYEWDFGDGTNGTGVTADHAYTEKGDYPVILTVRDNASIVIDTSTYALEDTLTQVITIIPVHDISVTSVTVSKATIVVGESLSIDATISNEGAWAATFNVTAYYDGTEIDTQTDISLDPGASTTLTFEWDTSGVTLGDYRVEIVASQVEGETDIADNTKQSGTVTVEEAPAPFPLEYVVIIIVVVVVVVVAIVVYLRTRSKKPPAV